MESNGGGGGDNGLAALDDRQLVRRLGAAQWLEATDLLFARGPATLEALIEGISDPDWRVRRGCAALMDHLGDERCVGPLRRALRDPYEAVRRAALHAIHCQHCKACPLPADTVAPLIEHALHDPSIRVRRVATHYLSEHAGDDERARRTLQTLAARESDAKIVSRARRGLESRPPVAATGRAARVG